MHGSLGWVLARGVRSGDYLKPSIDWFKELRQSI